MVSQLCEPALGRPEISRVESNLPELDMIDKNWFDSKFGLSSIWTFFLLEFGSFRVHQQFISVVRFNSFSTQNSTQEFDMNIFSYLLSILFYFTFGKIGQISILYIQADVRLKIHKNTSLACRCQSISMLLILIQLHC
jgi:hypothetical protein